MVRTVAAPPSIVVKCGGGRGSSCGHLWYWSCGVVCCVVLFLLCVCVCDLFLFLPPPPLFSLQGPHTRWHRLRSGAPLPFPPLTWLCGSWASSRLRTHPTPHRCRLYTYIYIYTYMYTFKGLQMARLLRKDCDRRARIRPLSEEVITKKNSFRT